MSRGYYDIYEKIIYNRYKEYKIQGSFKFLQKCPTLTRQINICFNDAFADFIDYLNTHILKNTRVHIIICLSELLMNFILDFKVFIFITRFTFLSNQCR